MREKKKAIIITICDPYPNMGNRLFAALNT